MRMILLFGAAVAAFATSAGAAWAISPNPSANQTPYAVLEPQSVAPPMMSEGRAALTGDWTYAPGPAFFPAAPAWPPTPESIPHGR
jgi:hypothetical protein